MDKGGRPQSTFNIKEKEMAEYTIDKIEYNGNVYKLQDNISGYITSVPTATNSTAGIIALHLPVQQRVLIQPLLQ